MLEEEEKDEDGIEDGRESEEGIGEKDNNKDRNTNIVQLDGNNTVSSLTSSEEESENNIEDDDIGISLEQNANNDESQTDKDIEPENQESNVTEEEEDDTIPVIIGNRPPQPIPAVRQPVRHTVKRNNNLVNALSTPRISLYNVRSAWSKWNNIAEDIKVRNTNLCFLTEVWQKSDKKKHQQPIESMLELNGIKYI